MTEWALDHGDIKVLQGDAREVLAQLLEASVQCIVTSPPFFALRDYGTGTWVGGDEGCEHSRGGKGQVPQTKFLAAADTVVAGGNRGAKLSCIHCGARYEDAQIGLEETPEEYVAAIVEVMRACRRVLRSDGVAYIEIGDTYAATSTYRAPQSRSTENGWKDEQASVPRPKIANVKPKDLIGIPWMVAFALRSDGWWLRSECIWNKPNAMTESVVDRPTRGHSTLFMLSKSARYFWDPDAVRTPHRPDGRKVTRHPGPGEFSAQARSNGDRWPGSGANIRTVWTIPTDSTSFAHFAVMAQEVVEKCIKSGTSEKGACAECGAPWQRIIETLGESGEDRRARAVYDRPAPPRNNALQDVGVEMAPPGGKPRVTTGWEPTCEHRDAIVMPCVVLDPFMGAATTGLVARKLGRHAVGVELSSEYIAIAEQRLQQMSLLT